MKPIVQTAFAIVALFALTACGGGGGGSTPVAENNPPTQAQPSTPPTNTDPTSPQPLPPPPAPAAPIDWRSDLTELGGGSYVTWDGAGMAISYYGGRRDMPTNAVFPSYVRDTLTFSDGLAWGAIAGDHRPAFGDVDIVLRVPTRTMTFDFDFPGTRLDSPIFARQLTGWQWQDSDGAGGLTRRIDTSRAPISNAPISVYGVESYDNSAGVEVQAAYYSVADEGSFDN